MKDNLELSKLNPIPVEELQEGAVYFTAKNQLVKIQKIDFERKELQLNNLSELCKEYKKLYSHNIVLKLRS